MYILTVLTSIDQNIQPKADQTDNLTYKYNRDVDYY